MKDIRVKRAFYIVCVVLLLLFGGFSCGDIKSCIAPRKVVCLGDSITYGYKLQEPELQSYPSRLAVLSNGLWRVLNCGVNGATVSKSGDIPIVEQKAFQQALDFQPDIVILLLGSNDMKNGNSRFRDAFVADYVEIVESLRNIASHPHVIACSIPPIFYDYPNGFTQKGGKEINMLVREAVLAGEIDFLDLYTPLLQSSAFFKDGIHPDARGAENIAKLVFQKIRSFNHQ